MSLKKELELINNILDSLPKQPNNQLQIVYRQGYLLGLLASIMQEDFYAHRHVIRRIEQIRQKQR